MEWKIISACSVVIGCMLAARSLSGALFRKCRMLDELISALRSLRISIVDRLEPMKMALTFSGAKLFEWTAGEIRQDVTAAEAWKLVRQRATVRGGMADCLGDDELRALDALFDCLGRTSGSRQELSIQNCVSALEEIRAEEKRKLKETSRLYTRLGILTGLAVAVLIV